GPDAPGASAAVGTGTNYARNDHDHGLPPFKQTLGGISNNNVSTTAGYVTPFGNLVGTTSATAMRMPYAGTLKNLSVNIITDALSSGHTWTITINVYSSLGGTLVDSSITTGAITG